ncbi:MAG: UDP-N-acetylmuramoyl-L-alanine--D-glutamate ligase [Patescibacteria group bacterium]|nr:UDP-N-acetylmuramoyl-L-alanine--D-glutamate ligase [Patescibacteria group bacterium]
MNNNNLFKNKKVLIFGLGSLGGGVATAKWFFKQGARLRITDFKTGEELRHSLEKLKDIKAEYILGKHRYEDIEWADYIIVNPAVTFRNEYIKYAIRKGKNVENDCSIFFKNVKGDVIAFTGTRGKTTTTNWTYFLIEKILGRNRMVIGGNQKDKSLLKILNKNSSHRLFVVEISSFQLEFYSKNIKAPMIAGITSIFNDHLNRYSSMEEYVRTKMKIFQNQKENDYLLLNLDNKWTDFILRGKPRSQVYFISLEKIPSRLLGAYYFKDHIIIRDKDEVLDLGNFKNFEFKYGEHNLSNLLFAILSTYIFLKKNNFNLPKNIRNIIFQLKTPKYRQEIVYQSKKLLIVNDSAGTSPDAVISAIKRFKKFSENIILITGGTDKNLDFRELARFLSVNIKSSNLIFLEGSATDKLIHDLKSFKLPIINQHRTLKDCFHNALELAKKFDKSVIIFSPGSASFEKFKNEFDRGKKFESLVKILIEKINK